MISAIEESIRESERFLSNDSRTFEQPYNIHNHITLSTLPLQQPSPVPKPTRIVHNTSSGSSGGSDDQNQQMNVLYTPDAVRRSSKLSQAERDRLVESLLAQRRSVGRDVKSTTGVRRITKSSRHKSSSATSTTTTTTVTASTVSSSKKSKRTTKRNRKRVLRRSNERRRRHAKSDDGDAFSRRAMRWMEKRDQSVQEKREVIMDEKMRECTFQPKVSSSSSVVGHNNGMSVSERLHRSADYRLVERDLSKRKREEAEVAQCSFTPLINETTCVAATADTPPLHQRIAELQKQKEAKLHVLRTQHTMEIEEHASFTPKINYKSKQIACQKLEDEGTANMSVGDRMHAESKEQQLRQQAHCTVSSVNSEAECTFEPQTNPYNDKLLSESNLYNGTFHERQERHLNVQKLKHSNAPPPPHCTFTPHIGNTDAVLANSRDFSSRNEENEQQRVERLSIEDRVRKQANVDMLRRREDSRFSFQPQILRFSRKIGGRRSVAEMSKNESGQRHRQRVQQKVKQEHENQCTFAPALAPKTRRMRNVKKKIDLKQPERTIESILEAQRRKRYELKRKQLQEEFVKTKECTFQPTLVSYSAPAPPVPSKIPIRGLDRFVARQERAKEMQEEQRQREEEVFMMKLPEGKDYKNYTTTPQPFHLSTNQRSNDQQQQQQQDADSLLECTFQPSTRTQQRHKLLQRILQS